jgi:hypothetical protein
MSLTRIERHWARAVCDTIFPPRAEGGSLPLGVAEMDLDAFFDDVVAKLPPEPAIGLRIAFFALAFAPLFTIGRFATFPSLARADRERVLKVVASSQVYVVRSILIGIKAVLSLFYCGDPRVRPTIWGAEESAAPRTDDLVALRVRKNDREPAPEGAAHEHFA